MPYFRILLFPLALGLILLVSGASAWQTMQPAAIPAPAPPAPAPPTEPDSVASEILERALGAIDPSRVRWLEMKLWQQVEVQGLAYEATGRYLIAPDHRFRLEVSMRQGAATGELLSVSDGHTLWQTKRVGDGAWLLSKKLCLTSILETLSQPEVKPEVRREFIQSQSMAGVAPLLQDLRQRLTWTRWERVRRQDREFIKLTGVGTLHEAAQFPWPEGAPRQCRLYLDAQSLWPHRIEWWGPDAPRVGDVPLFQTEYREPVLNQPLSEEQARREFFVDESKLTTKPEG